MQKAIQVLVGILPSICHNAFEVTLFMAAFTHSPLAFFFGGGGVVHEIVGGAISLQVHQYKSNLTGCRRTGRVERVHGGLP